jgi:hypothetical protein
MPTNSISGVAEKEPLKRQETLRKNWRLTPAMIATRPAAERSVICSVSGVAGMAPAAPVTLVLEPRGRLDCQPCMGSRGRGTAGTTGRSANPMAFPRIPQGDIIL